MPEKKIILLIDRFLSDELSDKEIKQLTDALTRSENRELFMDILEVKDLISPEGTKYIDTEKWLKDTRKKLARKKSVRKLFPYWTLKYAAVILVLVGLILFFNWEGKQRNNSVKPLDREVTLELGNGDIESISGPDNKAIKGRDGRIIGAKKGGNLYYTKVAPSAKMVFNKLTVPYGKTFRIVLSDGTVVHLNSGSSLRYPINFKEGGDRVVVLSGEGYFEVTKDSANPFVVQARGLNITVLGTRFDVSAYPEDTNVSTVLVEGAVSLLPNGEVSPPSALSPGHKATWERSDKDISIEPVDTENYTGWLSGKVICNHMSFKEILKILERHYDVSITNNNKSLDNEVFTASFDTETIEQVMASFQKNYALNYSINGNEITIN